MRDIYRLLGPMPILPEALRLRMLLHKGEAITLEAISAPFRPDKNAPCRQVSHTSAEGKLASLGWRMVPVPWLYREGPQGEGGCRLSWCNPRCWLVIPPGDASAQRFHNRRQALWWAMEQTGGRKAAKEVQS